MRIFQCNIWCGVRKEELLSYLKNNEFDLALLQEVHSSDLACLSAALGMPYFHWAPVVAIGENFLNFRPGLMGTAIFSKVPGVFKDSPVCMRKPLHFITDPDHSWTSPRPLITLDLGSIVFASLHFTWSPNGTTTQAQLEDFEHLKAALKTINKPLVLAGDFNAPAGGPIYTELSTLFTNNITHLNLKSSLDVIHPALWRNLVVDGVFSKNVKVSEVVPVEHVSDHIGFSFKVDSNCITK